MDDLKIIECCLLGNREEFSKLIDKYKNMVYNLTYRMCNNLDDAEDLSQEAFLRAFQSLSRFNPAYKFSTWLYQITLNIVRDRFKKKSLNYLSLDAPIETEDSKIYQQHSDSNGTSNPEEIFTQQEKSKSIERAILSLPLTYREVVVLRHLQGLSYSEISSILKIPTGTVKIRLYRARQTLKEILNEK
jgi:RNA polymerase sigma-70 factor (ECF subfamily)